MIFHHPILIEFADTDAAGICHFANYLRFMERVEHAFFRSLGLSVVTVEGDRHVSFPRVRAECEYRAPARFEEIIDAELSVERMGGKSISFVVEFSRDGKPVARGRMVCVCCHMTPDGAITPIDIPDFIRGPVQPYVRPADSRSPIPDPRPPISAQGPAEGGRATSPIPDPRSPIPDEDRA